MFRHAGAKTVGRQNLRALLEREIRVRNDDVQEAGHRANRTIAIERRNGRVRQARCKPHRPAMTAALPGQRTATLTSRSFIWNGLLQRRTRVAICAHWPGLRTIAIARPRPETKRRRSPRGPSIKNSCGPTGTRELPSFEKKRPPIPFKAV